MPEGRDRLSRAVDLAEVYARRRRSILSGINGRRDTLTGLADDPEEVGPTTPFRWGATPLTGGRGGIGSVDGGGSGGFEFSSPGTPGIRPRSRLQRSPGTITGRQNISPATRSSRGRVRGRGRGRGGGVLPDWYPRVPLQDITEIVRAIERRRARMREGEGPQIETPVPQQQAVQDVTVSTSGAQFEHGTSTFTPYNKGSSKSLSISVPKILLDITNQNDGESSGLTPQKKLLNSIDTVEKVVSEELRKMKRTPAAKKAEREKKVKTLMSMR
ncbi:OLC1v1037034C1 [Oldenlandia corymbosa var. corymbosa]|uniref:OLC1v1037034C1 n=1 Tax=Oldenlandia corymbosa var. corymbosa TaxID=529605 RepID=A0AAV1CZD5_OLDCO|nr:OLC1v1037034C1 [Oldenlandia corymbosa var. corymbosa]